MESKKINVVYAEPANYIPEELRRKYKLGEFAEPKHGAEEMDEDCGGIKPIDPIKPQTKADEAKPFTGSLTDGKAADTLILSGEDVSRAETQASVP